MLSYQKNLNKTSTFLSYRIPEKPKPKKPKKITIKNHRIFDSDPKYYNPAALKIF